VQNLVDIKLNNTGKEAHQATLLKIADGKTIDDVKNALAAEGGPSSGPPPFTAAGGTTATAPGSSVTVTQALPAGSYAFICFVPGADGAPHFVKGMIAPISVTGTSTTSLPLPEGKNSTATEYSYDLPALAAGTTTLRVRNAGQQDHEYQIGQLADGKTAADAQAWLTNPQGPPPMTFVGGPVVGAPGGTNSVKLNLKKGNYVFYCNIPDRADGKPHFAHGMFKGVTVT
jgi:uncharacterized cupredoxin-like copper-binding protein